MTDPYRIEIRSGSGLVATIALSPETAARLMAAPEAWLEVGGDRLPITIVTNPSEGD